VRMRRKMTPETLLKRDIKQYLGYHGWFCFHVLQGLGAYKGVSDMIAIKGGNVLFIEVKRPRGTQSEYQKEFERRVTEKGGKYVVVRSVDDLAEAVGGMLQKKMIW